MGSRRQLPQLVDRQPRRLSRIGGFSTRLGSQGQHINAIWGKSCDELFGSASLASARARGRAPGLQRAGRPLARISSRVDGQPSRPVRFGTWGVDIGTRDLAVKPGDDFQRYASGKWLDANRIPADKSQNGVGSELNDRNQEQLRAIVMGAPKDSQLGAFYASYMDEARLEQLDAAPLKADLDRGRGDHDQDRFRALHGRHPADFGGTLFGLGMLRRSRPTRR